MRFRRATAFHAYGEASSTACWVGTKDRRPVGLIMRIDSHQHFWRYLASEYPWIDNRLGMLRRDFMPADLEPLLDRLGFDGSIAVQARQSVEETEWLLRLAEANPFVKGVVGWVDLRASDIGDRLRFYVDRPKLVGVRHVVHDEPNEDFMLEPEFRNGIATLGDHGLAYDLLLFPRHLPAAMQLVREFPEQHFVLDHIAKPSIARAETDPWSSDLKRLADLPNVYCKLSGMVTEAAWSAWRPDDFMFYLDVITQAFGLERLMIGSDWPVCTASADYNSTMGVVMDYLEGFPAAAREAVLGGNCARWYRLPNG